tara:strand:+ start:539 stop:664 length:126 start_codon:yes stop_codon:yes gene_type:complete
MPRYLVALFGVSFIFGDIMIEFLLFFPVAYVIGAIIFYLVN